MKHRLSKVLITIGICFLLALPTAALADDLIEKEVMQDAVTITAGSSDTSDALWLTHKKAYGSFSLQLSVSGSGTVKAEYLLSNDNTTFVEPSSASDIVTGFTASSGPGSDGKDLFSFHPMVARQLKIKITETGGVDSATVTATLGYQ